MSRKSLANKYRPSSFDNGMVGQKHIVPILKQNIIDDTKNINYILYGPRWTGKTSSARIIAKGINCLHQHDGNPCDECENCKLIDAGQVRDIVEMDAASHTGVDNIREEIIEKALYRPVALKKKVYIIDEVHMLSKSAFNALLKIMEEPADYLCFILATTDIQKVPETIISRCQVFNFRTIWLEDITNHLEWICTQENIKNEKNWLALISKLSDGCLRDAVKYLDQVSVLGVVDEKTVSEFLGITSLNQIAEFVSLYKICYDSTDTKLQNESIQKLLQFVDEIQKSGANLENFAKDLLVYCNDNFQSDYVFYSVFAEKIKNIYINLRNYPNPILAYKVEILKK